MKISKDARGLYERYTDKFDESLRRTLEKGKEHGFFVYTDGVSDVLEGMEEYFPHRPDPERKLVLAIHSHPKGYPVFPSQIDKLVHEVEGNACIAGFTDEKKIIFCTIRKGLKERRTCTRRVIDEHMGKVDEMRRESRRTVEEAKRLPRVQFLEKYEEIRDGEKRELGHLFKEREEKVDECRKKIKVTYEHSYHEIGSNKLVL